MQLLRKILKTGFKKRENFSLFLLFFSKIRHNKSRKKNDFLNRIVKKISIDYFDRKEHEAKNIFEFYVVKFEWQVKIMCV